MDDNKKTILVVEDDEVTRNILNEKLIGAGYSVSVTKDGEAGLASALSGHPDLILLDILMPKMDGLEFLKRLREDAWGKDSTVMLLTNFSDNEKIAEVIQYGVRDYLVKSDWKIDDVLEKIKQKIRE